MKQRTSPEAVTHARTLYAQGKPIQAIADATGLTPRQISYWLKRDRPAEGDRSPPPPRRRRAGPARASTAASRRRLMGRLWKAAEQQIAEIETRIDAAQAAASPDEAGIPRRDAEREARALALLARVVRELSALETAARRAAPDAALTRTDPAGSFHEAADGGRDLDTFRRELARRLDRLRQRAEGADPSD